MLPTGVRTPPTLHASLLRPPPSDLRTSPLLLVHGSSKGRNDFFPLIAHDHAIEAEAVRLPLFLRDRREHVPHLDRLRIGNRVVDRDRHPPMRITGKRERAVG